MSKVIGIIISAVTAAAAILGIIFFSIKKARKYQAE